MNGSTDQCKTCAFRFRRVFVPSITEEFVDDEGHSLDIGDDNIVIMNVCLLTGMDISGECTIECAHYKEKGSMDINDLIPLFRSNNF